MAIKILVHICAEGWGGRGGGAESIREKCRYKVVVVLIILGSDRFVERHYLTARCTE
jgi:hypothetical protein